MKLVLTSLLLLLASMSFSQITITDAEAKAGVKDNLYKEIQEFILDPAGAGAEKGKFKITGVKTAGDDFKKYMVKFRNATTEREDPINGELKGADLVFELAGSMEVAKGIFRLFYDDKEKGVIQFEVKKKEKVENGKELGTSDPTGYDPAKDDKLLRDATVEARDFVARNGIKADKRTNTFRKGNKVILFVDAQGNYLIKGPPTAAFRQNTYIVLLIKRKDDPFIYQLIPPVSFLSDQFNIYGDSVTKSVASAAKEKVMKSGLVVIEFAEIGPYEEEFQIQIKKTNPGNLASTNIIDTKVKVAKLYHVSIQGAMIGTSLRDPQNVRKVPIDNGDSTLTADDPKGRGLFCVMAVWYPWGRSFIFPPRGGLFSRERFGLVVGVRADKDQFKNFIGGLQFDFARGGSVSLGIHYGRHTVVDGKKDFDFGKDIFTGSVTDKVRQQWDLGAYVGVNIDIRVLNFLFGGALAAVDE